MKNLKNITFIVLAVSLIAMGIGFAETGRMGQNYAKAFNPTKSVYKTAAYTLTATDSLVNVTATSANIVITLPSIADVTGSGTKSYKILKKDATAYHIVVTPATGETIGFESTRRLIGDEAYMVISAQGGKNWSVDYETSYVQENHALGTFASGTTIGSGGLFQAITSTVTLSSSHCGNILSLTTPTVTVTLPASIAMCEYTFLVTAGQGTGMAKIQLDTSDTAYGMVLSRATTSWMTVAAGGTIGLSRTVANRGDNITLVGNGNGVWYIKSVATGTWVTPWAM